MISKSNIFPKVLLALSLAIHILLCVLAARLETPTVDEFAHVPAGLAYWKYGSLDLYSKNPPLVKLWVTLPLAIGAGPAVVVPAPQGNPSGWGPWQYGSQFEQANKNNFLTLFFAARLMVIFFSVGTALIIYAWAWKLFGEWPAALAAAGFLFSPTVLAHGHLATTDGGATFFISLFIYGLFRSDKNSRKNSALAGILLGLAIGAKFTGILLVPVLLIWIALKRKKILVNLILSLMLCLLTVNLCYGFKESFRPLDSYAFSSKAMTFAKSLLPGRLLIPLPSSFVTGFDGQTADTENGEFGNYFFGKWSRDGWWYYNIAAFLMKENCLTILFLFALPWALYKTDLDFKNLFLLAAPVVFIGIPLTFFNKLQIGVRYLLPLFPFLFVGIALVFSRVLKAQERRRGFRAAFLSVSLLVWVATALTAFPSYISYFNPAALLFGPKEDLLLDSNLDWGQDLYRLRGINERLADDKPVGLLYFGHVSPSVYDIRFQLIPSVPVRGILAVSANFLKGYPYVAPTPDENFVDVPAGHLDWLKAFKPIEIDGSIFIFDTREGGAP